MKQDSQTMVGYLKQQKQLNYQKKKILAAGLISLPAHNTHAHKGMLEVLKKWGNEER